MQIAKLSLAAIIGVVIVVNCIFGVNGRAHRQIGLEDNAEKWAQQNYATALSRVLPGGDIAVSKFPKNVKWMVTVRILPPFEKPEYRFSMQKMYDGRVEMSVIKAKGSSIISQLQALKGKYPEDSLEKLCDSISLEQLKITQYDTRQLGRLADQFEAINISPVLPDELRVDDTGYELWSQSQWGNRMSLTISGPGPGAKRQPHPLLRWAESVRSAIDASSPQPH